MASFTQDQLDKLQAAMATGSLEVWYGDKRVVYRSLDEMIRLANLMKADLNQINPGSTRIFARFNKGLDECN